MKGWMFLIIVLVFIFIVIPVIIYSMTLRAATKEPGLFGVDGTGTGVGTGTGG